MSCPGFGGADDPVRLTALKLRALCKEIRYVNSISLRVWSKDMYLFMRSKDFITSLSTIYLTNSRYKSAKVCQFLKKEFEKVSSPITIITFQKTKSTNIFLETSYSTKALTWKLWLMLQMKAVISQMWSYLVIGLVMIMVHFFQKFVCGYQSLKSFNLRKQYLTSKNCKCEF